MLLEKHVKYIKFQSHSSINDILEIHNNPDKINRFLAQSGLNKQISEC